MKKLKAAVIGVGSMGRHHARNYSEIGNVNLVAVSDQDEKIGKAIAKQSKTKYYKDFGKMLEIEKPDLVSIAVPTKFHKDVALEVINRKINLLIEKPIAYNIDEAKEIADSAKKANVILTVGHIERFNPAVIGLKRIIKQGKLGKIVSIMARRAGTIPSRIKDANVILDIGVHDIDLLNFILDKKPHNIYACGGRAILKKHEDYADILLEYPSHKNGLKVTGHIQTNWITPIKIRKLNITGTKGYAIVKLLTQELILFDTKYTQEFDDFSDFVGKFKEHSESEGKKIKVQLKEPLRAELEHFIECIAKNKKPLVSSEDSIWALKTAIMATEIIKIKGNQL